MFVPEVPLEDQDYTLWVLLNQLHTLMLNVRERELAKYGTAAMQAAVLFIASALGETTTPADLSRWFIRKPAGSSGLLNRMEKAELVEKVKDLPKKNWIRVILTEKGQKAYNNSLKRKAIHQIIGCLSEQERAQLTQILFKLRTKAAKLANYNTKIPFP